MIGYLRGTIAELTSQLVVLDVGGVGYNVRINDLLASRLPGIGTEIKIYTYTYVKEDAFLLYGFQNADELSLFKLLIAVSGIGPKGALAILSVMSADQLRLAIYTGDAKAIAKAPGIGAKTAERVILDLKDKVSIEDSFGTAAAPDGNGQEAFQDIENAMSRDAVLALTALGYSRNEAAAAVNKAAKEEATDVETLLKYALKYLV